MECGKRQSHWPHPVVVDGLTEMCIGKGAGHRIFWGWPSKVVHLISDLRKLHAGWRLGGL